MSVALRTITRLQDADDINVSLGAGVDEYALCWDNDTAKFVLRAPAAPFAGILATGATVGATSQAQAFTNGIVGPSWKPSADSTTALQLQKADGTSVLNVDTTNGRVSIGRAPEGVTFAVNGSIQIASGGYIGYRISSDTTIPIFWNINSSLSRLYTGYAGAKLLTINDPSVGTEIATFDGVNARFGIGATSPATTLHVVGAATITGGIRPAADSTTALQLQNASGTSVLNVDTTNGRVGIGTTAPTTRMDVAATLTNTSGIVGGASVYTTTMSPSANGTASIRNVQYELVSGNDKEISGATNVLMYQYANSYMVNLIGMNVASRYGATANVVTERMLYLSQDSKAGGAVIGTKTGLYIDAITHGNTNYAIYTNAGKLRFGDIVNFAGTMGDSAKNPATDAPADWVQIEIGGVTHYLPAYAAA